MLPHPWPAGTHQLPQKESLEPGRLGGLLLQLDSTTYFRSPPPGSGIAATTGSGDFKATAPDSYINNESGEHAPFGLNVPSLPRDLVKALPELGVEDLPDRWFRQTFPADPHDAFGSVMSVKFAPLPADLTHHQVVIS